MMQIVFTDEEREWLVRGSFNWCVKDGAPKHVKKSLEEKIDRLENYEWEHMRARVANASKAEKDRMEAEIVKMKEIRKRQREQIA